jgi:membrane-associated protein
VQDAFLANPLDPLSLLSGAGPWALVALAAIIFIETGLLFPFLPGDSLLFAAGLLSPQLGIPLPLLLAVAASAAIAGDQLGYLLGRRYGRRMFTPDARILKASYLDRADVFFLKHGAKALVLARFVPIARTFVPPVVGMSRLPYRTFATWNVVGAIAWVSIAVLAGLWLGGVPWVAQNVDAIALGVVAVSVVPLVIEMLRARRAARSVTEG